MPYIKRLLQNEIEKWMFSGKVIILYGARQVGKTTLVKQLLQPAKDRALYLNCDEPDIRGMLTDKNSAQLRQIIGDHTILAIDEAQRVINIGITLKLLADLFPDLQVIATGSSSLDLALGIKEPLTGRKMEFNLYPFSAEELLSTETTLDFTRLLPSRMILGVYPGVVFSHSKEKILKEITESYLYKDLFEIQKIRNPHVLHKLLQALALQIGSEVSYNELGTMLQLDNDTIGRYINILIQTNVLFELPPLKRNLRNTLGKLRKIYFCDLGIRNTLINNFNPLELRNDTGPLWENFCILERRKFNENHQVFPNTFFWRAYDKSEIDYLEEIGGRFNAFECKWKDVVGKLPKAFMEAFPNSTFETINRNNFLKFVIKS